MDKKAKMRELLEVMLSNKKVTVMDKHDHKVKESSISAIYCDYTVILSDTVHSDYKIKDVSIVKKAAKRTKKIDPLSNLRKDTYTTEETDRMVGTMIRKQNKAN